MDKFIANVCLAIRAPIVWIRLILQIFVSRSRHFNNELKRIYQGFNTRSAIKQTLSFCWLSFFVFFIRIDIRYISMVSISFVNAMQCLFYIRIDEVFFLFVLFFFSFYLQIYMHGDRCLNLHHQNAIKYHLARC